MITLGLLYRIQPELTRVNVPLAVEMSVAFDASRRRHSQSYRHDTIIGSEGNLAVVAGYLLSVRPRCYFPFEVYLGHALSSGS